MGRCRPAFCFLYPIWTTATPTELHPYTGGVQTQLTIQTIHRAPSLTSPDSHCHLPTGNHRLPLPPSPAGHCWLLTSNFKFRSRRSALLRESHLHVCRLLCIHSQQPALCARLQSATHCSSPPPPR